MSSAADKIKGKTKQAIGAATDNKELKLKGKAQETKGKVKQSAKKAGDTAARKLDTMTKN